MDKLKLIILALILVIPSQADIKFTNTAAHDQLIDCGSAAGIDDIWSGGYQIWIRFKIDGASTNGQHGLWVSRNGADGGIQLNTRNDTTDYIQEAHDTDGTTWFRRQGADSTVPDTNAWYNYFHSWTGVAGTGEANGLNGTEQAAGSIVIGSGTMTSDAAHNKTIGANNGETGLGANATFKSMVIWSNDEITTNAATAAMTSRTITTRQMMNFWPEQQLLCFEFLDGSHNETEADETVVTNLCPQNSGVVSCTLRGGLWLGATTN